MRKTRSHTTPAPAGKKPARKIDQQRKLDIIGILMIVCALFLFLALLSHATADEAASDIGIRDLFKLFGGDSELQARADVTSNWLGLLGAVVASFLLYRTIGYFAIAFPILLAVWGWFILRKKDLHTLAFYTNYSVLLAFLLSALGGLFRLVSWFPELPPPWAGNIGDFLAGILARLIGTTGGIIAIAATLVILAVVVVDYNIHHTLDRLRAVLRLFAGTLRPHATAVAAAGTAAAGTATAGTAAAGTAAAATTTARTAAAAPRSPAMAAPAPVPPASTPPAQRIAVSPASIEAEDAAARHIPVTISRPDDVRAPLRSAPAPPSILSTVTADAGLRSNGTIPKESIPGYRDAMEKARQEQGAGSAAAGSAAADMAGAAERTARAERTEHAGAMRGTAAPLRAAGESLAPSRAATPDHPALSDQERRAIAQAGSAKAAVAGSGDVEEVNRSVASERLASYRYPPLELLDEAVSVSRITNDELKVKADLVIEKLAVFGIAIKDINVIPGPVVTQFELVPDSSVKISKIVSLADDLALALAARGIRIIAPIPGKGAVGVEIPNNEPEMVNFRSVVSSTAFQRSRAHLPLALGKSITGDVYCDDLSRMPHLLIAGATGSGKSVGINVMISSLLFKLHPSDVKFILIDPKKIELAQYGALSRHFLAVCPDIDEEIITDPANAVQVLRSLELEMDKRYTKLARAGVRHVNDYNAKIKAGQLKDSDQMVHYRLPYIVVVVDELADLMITAAREVEEPIARLAQLSRAVGIHLVLATQRPSVDIITGVIKANFSARIAYQVASKIDSRTILDTPGADRLLGNGDMLYQPSGQPKPVRIQNAFLSTGEVERIVEFISEQRGQLRPYLLPSLRDARKNNPRDAAGDRDDLLDEAARLIVRHQQGSVSLLQRRLRIGYSRAARIVDQLETAGIVGPYDGSKARAVLVESEQDLDLILQQL